MRICEISNQICDSFRPTRVDVVNTAV